MNLRPTWRSMPTSSNPHLACSARDAVPDASMRAITAWNPEARAIVDEPAEQQRADALAAGIAVDVHRVLDGRAVGGPVLVRRQRGEADHRRSGRRPSTATIAENAPDRAAQPALAGRRATAGRGRTCSSWSSPRGCRWPGSPRHRRRPPAARDAGITSRRSGSGRRPLPVTAPVPVADQVDGVDRDRRRYAGRAGSRRVDHSGRASASALLAQSAEHSHGKAGVVGSIPTEGSTVRSAASLPAVRPADRAAQTPGGVAQSVRASGS